MSALTGLYATHGERRMALRHAVMLGTFGEQRQGDRLLTTAPAVMHVDDERHIGLVRDLSSTGLFVYSDFNPSVGTELKITVRLSSDKNKSAVFICTGRVVRVEDSNNGSAVGIGVRFQKEQSLTAEPQ